MQICNGFGKGGVGGLLACSMIFASSLQGLHLEYLGFRLCVGLERVCRDVWPVVHTREWEMVSVKRTLRISGYWR